MKLELQKTFHLRKVNDFKYIDYFWKFVFNSFGLWLIVEKGELLYTYLFKNFVLIFLTMVRDMCAKFSSLLPGI